MEGLKRIYIVLALPVVIAGAAATWIDSHPMCLDQAAMSNDELLNALRRADATGDTAGAKRLADYLAGLQAHNSSAAQTSGIDPKTVIWDKPGCTTKAQRLGRTALGAAVAGGALFILWLIFRWVVAGFAPSLKREK